MHPRKLVRDTIGFAFTQYVARALLMLRGVLAARLLGPNSYGAWNAIQLVCDYGAYFHLGTQQGLDQAVPAHLVDQDANRLRRLLRSGLFNAIVLPILFGLGGILYFSRSTGAIRTTWGMRGVTVAYVSVLLVTVSNVFLTVLRSYGRIRVVSEWFLLQAIVATGLGLALIPWQGAWGLLWGWVAANLLALIFARWRAPVTVPVRPAYSPDSLMLIRAGLPMLLYLTSALVMRTVDRIVILKFAGTQALGYYSLGVMALTLLLYLPDSISYVLYPQLLRGYRESGDVPAAIRPRAQRAIQTVSAVVPGLCGLAFLGARDAVLVALPNFGPGVSALRVLCFGAAGLAVAGLSSIVLMTLRRQTLLIPAALFATALGAGLDTFVLRAGAGIDGVAWATFATYVIHGAVMLFLAMMALGADVGARLREIARVYAPLAIALVLVVLLDRYLPWRGTLVPALRWSRLALSELGFAALYVAFAYPLVRGLGLRVLAEELLIRRMGRRVTEPVA